MVSKIIYFGYYSNMTLEGGQARNNAFWQYFSGLKCLRKFNLNTQNHWARKINMLYFWFYLYFVNKKTIFIHQICIVSLFYINSRKLKKICFNLCNYLLTRVASRNELIIEVNDLYYEQSIDLKLCVDSDMELFQFIMYGIDRAHYIFASNEMAKYSKLKYLVKSFRTIINGAPMLEFPNVGGIKNVDLIYDDKIRCVYAGSLNRGRQIEELIQVFSTLQHAELILIGDMGEWLLTHILPQNVNYLGSFNEMKAMQVVNSCDLGLIPYSTEVKYYNLCYPTKASFYLNAGVPFLSTPLQELMSEFEKLSDIVKFADINQWHNLIDGFSKVEIAIIKGKLLESKVNYSWNKLLDDGLSWLRVN
ncbi:MAG: hypothetical protein K2X04_11605 [Burkholderiales bacterium]|nr:hypothetical protein [Burkholderiales bacterium]